MFTLKHHFALYVPSTFDVNQFADSSLIQSLVNYVTYSMSSLFGGTSEYLAIGSYVANNGELVRESVRVIKSFCSEDDFTSENLNQVLAMARLLCFVLKQECIAVEIDSTLNLVDLSPAIPLESVA